MEGKIRGSSHVRYPTLKSVSTPSRTFGIRIWTLKTVMETIIRQKSAASGGEEIEKKELKFA